MSGARESDYIAKIPFSEEIMKLQYVDSITWIVESQLIGIIVGMVEFGSELWFEPEPLRTRPWFSPRFESEGELNQWSGPGF